MQNIIVDEEFRLYLPALKKDAYDDLERLILKNGVRDPLVLWNDIIIDGYNRYKVCIEHDIPFTTVSMEFDSREDAKDWIIDNQLARRNLSPIEQSHYRGVLFNSAKRKRGVSNQYTNKSAIHQSDGKQNGLNTAREVGKRFNVSSATIERDGRVANALNAIAEVSLEAKRKVLSGEIPVDRSKLQRLSKASKEEIEEVAKQINDGTYDRKDHRISKIADTTEKPDGETDNINAPEKPDNEIDNSDNAMQSPNLIKEDSTGSIAKYPEINEADYVDTIVSLIAGNLNTTLKSLTNEGGIPELKTSLRALITNLEELYGNIKSD